MVGIGKAFTGVFVASIALVVALAISSSPRYDAQGTFKTENLEVTGQAQVGATNPTASQIMEVSSTSATTTGIFNTDSSDTNHTGFAGNNELIHWIGRNNTQFDTTAHAGQATMADLITNCGESSGALGVTCRVFAPNAECATADCTAYVWDSQFGIMKNDGEVIFGAAARTSPVTLGDAVTRFTVMPKTPLLTTPQLDIGIVAPVDGYNVHIKNTATGVAAMGLALEGDTSVTAAVAPQLVLYRNAGGTGSVFGLVCMDNGAASCLAAASANDLVIANYASGKKLWLAAQGGAGISIDGANRINNVTDPSATQDVATKNYVDSKAVTVQQAAFHLDSGTGLYTKQQGMSGSPVKNGVGDWTLTYSTALNTDQGLVLCQVQDQGGSATRMNITVQSIDTTHIRVRTFSNGSASDQHFWCSLSSIN